MEVNAFGSWTATLRVTNLMILLMTKDIRIMIATLGQRLTQSFLPRGTLKRCSLKSVFLEVFRHNALYRFDH
jgi:hypothetical protein